MNKKVLLLSLREYSNCFYADKLNFFDELISENIGFHFISFNWLEAEDYIVSKLKKIIDISDYEIVYFLNDSFNIISSDVSIRVLEKLKTHYTQKLQYGMQYYDEKFIHNSNNIDQIYLGAGSGFAESVKNIATLKSVRENKQVHILKNKISLPEYVLNFEDYIYYVIETNSLCIHSCSFCNKSDKDGVTFKELPYSLVINYLNNAKENNFNIVWLLDPSFNENKNIADISAILEKYKFRYIFEIRPETFSQGLLKYFKNLDVMSFNVGLQSIDREVGEMNRRIFHKKAYERGVTLMKTQSKVFIDVIIGLPGDTIKTFLKTVQYVSNLNGTDFRIFLLEKRPNSFRDNDVYISDIHFDDRFPYKVISTKWLSPSDIELARKYAKTLNVDFN